MLNHKVLCIIISQELTVCQTHELVESIALLRVDIDDASELQGHLVDFVLGRAVSFISPCDGRETYKGVLPVRIGLFVKRGFWAWLRVDLRVELGLTFFFSEVRLVYSIGGVSRNRDRVITKSTRALVFNRTLARMKVKMGVCCSCGQ